MKKFFLTIMVALATVVSVGTQASASTKTYHSKYDNSYVKVTKNRGKVSKINFWLTNTKKFKKQFQKRAKFSATMTIINSTHAKLIRKNERGKVTYNGNMPVLSLKRHTSEVQSSPMTGPESFEDQVDGIFINSDYFGKYANKHKNMIASFDWWWNTMDDDDPTVGSTAYIYKNGNVKFAKLFTGNTDD